MIAFVVRSVRIAENFKFIAIVQRKHAQHEMRDRMIAEIIGKIANCNFGLVFSVFKRIVFLQADYGFFNMLCP